MPRGPNSQVTTSDLEALVGTYAASQDCDVFKGNQEVRFQAIEDLDGTSYGFTGLSTVVHYSVEAQSREWNYAMRAPASDEQSSNHLLVYTTSYKDGDRLHFFENFLMSPEQIEVGNTLSYTTVYQKFGKDLRIHRKIFFAGEAYADESHCTLTRKDS